MKKAAALLLVLSILLSCFGCAAAHSCESACESCGLCLNQSCEEADCQEKCQGHHTCTNSCESCGLCTNSSCTEAVCLKKCAGHHSCTSICDDCGLCKNAECPEAVCQQKCEGHPEEPYVFSSGDYITTEAVSIDTGTFVYDLDANVYVRGDLQAITDVIVPLIEQFTGLDFDGAGYARKNFPDGKIHIDVARAHLYAGQDWYMGSNDSELGLGYASSMDHVDVAPGDLYFGNSTIIHEASHVLMWRQSEWSYCQLLNEGISTYTTYLVERELEKSDPQTGFSVNPSKQSINDIEIHDYAKLYEQPLEYWFENTFEYSNNANYAIGFRFMAYLQDTYGNYTKWVTKFEEMYPYTSNRSGSEDASVKRQIEVLKATYGEDVLDNFYPWLKENQKTFDFIDEPCYSDLTALSGVNLYPTFSAIESRARITYFQYKDLYINVETVRTYVSDYKKLDATGLTLFTSQPVTVNLYQADGSYTTVTTETEISLEGISYIKLVGQGTLDLLEVRGPFRYWYLENE